MDMMLVMNVKNVGIVIFKEKYKKYKHKYNERYHGYYYGYEDGYDKCYDDRQYDDEIKKQKPNKPKNVIKQAPKVDLIKEVVEFFEDKDDEKPEIKPKEVKKNIN